LTNLLVKLPDISLRVQTDPLELHRVDKPILQADSRKLSLLKRPHRDRQLVGHICIRIECICICLAISSRLMFLRYLGSGTELNVAKAPDSFTDWGHHLCHASKILISSRARLLALTISSRLSSSTFFRKIFSSSMSSLAFCLPCSSLAGLKA